MKRFVILTAFALPALGCGGSDLPTTNDPDAIRREQERLSGGAGGGPKSAPKGAKDDAVRREQERLSGKK